MIQHRLLIAQQGDVMLGKRISVLLFALALSISWATSGVRAGEAGTYGQDAGSSIALVIGSFGPSGEEKKVPVKGYYRKNGTYVAPHTRESKGSGKAKAYKAPKAAKASPAYKAPSSDGKVKRDSHGKIKRSQGAIHSFRKGNVCPSTGKTTGKCPGYEVDHVKPLACGGADDPSNMQWLTKDANRKKGAMGCERR